MSTFITRLRPTGGGLRLAVKDLIDLAGLPTTAASKAVAENAEPAGTDALCMSGARERERAGTLRIVGKANLHELAFGATGKNGAFGTPVNPLDPKLVPGGSSSGSAVAVATGEADVAYGSDTGGSVRIPSACCGTAGLKTTHGRVSVQGVFPLAPSLDTIGPMARDVSGLVEGMRLLEPGFATSSSPPTVIGRFRPCDVDPEIDSSLDLALASSELDVVEVALPGWSAAFAAGGTVILGEAWRGLGGLLERRELLGRDVAGRIDQGRTVGQASLDQAGSALASWRSELEEVLSEVGAIALPAMAIFPPRLDGADDAALTACTMPVNAAGTPAVVLPVPTSGPMPASLQLVGPHGSEESLLALAGRVEAAVS